MLNRLRLHSSSSSLRNLSPRSTTSKFILRQTSSLHFHPISISSSHPTRSDSSFQHSHLRNYATQPSTNQSYNMSIEQSMREKLQKELDPMKLNIRNDSSKHSHHAAMVAQGGGSGETHFFIEVISDSFKGKPQLARHRLINGILKQEFENGLHALSLRLKTREEEEKGMKA